MKKIIKNKRLVNAIYLVITVIAFSLSIFKTDSPIWIAAWIAPIFLLRFMRDNKWSLSIILGFIVLQIASFIGLIPQLDMMSAT